MRDLAWGDRLLVCGLAAWYGFRGGSQDCPNMQGKLLLSLWRCPEPMHWYVLARRIGCSSYNRRSFDVHLCYVRKALGTPDAVLRTSASHYVLSRAARADITAALEAIVAAANEALHPAPKLKAAS
jgi:hypothetical protein